MIKDPWPMEWSPFTEAGLPDWRFQKRYHCVYSQRYSLPCATSRRKCMGCYMRQQHINDEYNRYFRKHGEPKVVHICDRCGAEITKIDDIIYQEVTNRLGGLLSTQELCPACAGQLNEWINGTDIQIGDEIPEDEYEGFWD